MLLPSIFENDITDMFEDMFRTPYNRGGWNNVKSICTDIRETQSQYELSMELPGYAKEDISAELDKGYMTITAVCHRDNDEKDESGRYIRRERYSGSCKRSFYVGENVREEDINASFTDGVLKITFPKPAKNIEEKEKKLIAIQ